MPMDPRIVTVEHPSRYTHTQLERAARVAQKLNRGKLFVFEPARWPQRLRKA